MDEGKKPRNTSVRTDFLLVLMISNLVLQNVQQWRLVPIYLIILTLFTTLHSSFVRRFMHPLLSMAATVIFLRNVALFQGAEMFVRTLVLLTLLLGLHFLLFRFWPSSLR